MVITKTRMTRPTESFLERIQRATHRDARVSPSKLSESGVCMKAGYSRSALSVARTRVNKKTGDDDLGGIGWDIVHAVTKVLAANGISRDWLLWGEGHMMANPLRDLANSGSTVRVGEDADTVPGTGSNGKGSKRRVEGSDTLPNAAPRAGKNHRRVKRA